MCVCVCVCVRERERARARDLGLFTLKQVLKFEHLLPCVPPSARLLRRCTLLSYMLYSTHIHAFVCVMHTHTHTHTHTRTHTRTHTHTHTHTRTHTRTHTPAPRCMYTHKHTHTAPHSRHRPAKAACSLFASACLRSSLSARTAVASSLSLSISNSETSVP